ncbi:urocanate hydratase [Octopus vulgaris]|uniref:Urocanate hydratase n=1 Tax=Octopus vulgaris TaxID=6645 RepID=A0AA36AH02_OCTVU|nr:urocanate hydratase [Octopus vulgaris]
MHMIMNNLNPEVAQFPHELVTYGGNGQVFSNWIQFLLVMYYLSNMTEEQTLVMYSGHPMGLFPSNNSAPRMVITNGMLTLLNAARMYLKTDDLSGKVFVTSGLGGMSGAQAKAAVIAGCVGVVAEVDKNALIKRYKQGWLLKIAANLDHCVELIRTGRKEKKPTSIGYHGNVVDLWDRLITEYENTGELLVDLGSDQTSCHNPFAGGADVGKCETMCGTKFRYPSYVQDIMGDIFSLGFGPFRWVCTSGDKEDLEKTDMIAASILEKIASKTSSAVVREQYKDNIRWIKEAGQHKMVVGSQARILYADQNGRSQIALEFNKAVKEGKLKGPVVISRDHHDVSGTDSPFRETSNIYDGSALCAAATTVEMRERAENQARTMLAWDVSNGVARRSWSGNLKARETIKLTMKDNPCLQVTIPYSTEDDSMIENVLKTIT